MEEEEPLRSRGLDNTPLLQNPNRRNSINGSRFSFLLSRATRSRIMRQPSMLVRETSALQFDERQSDWGYSKPVVVLDVIWNLAFVLVSALVLSSTVKERPSTPLRIWIGGYALQCLLHVGFVYFEYQRRLFNGREVEDEVLLSQSRTGVAKRMESMNTIVSFFWWVIGFYWIVVGGQTLLQDAPRLYWLAVVFLAFDVFFAIFCITLACIIGITLCCCLPCIMAVLYAMTVREGATEDDIRSLPRYRFRQISRRGSFDLDTKLEDATEVRDPSTSGTTSEITLPTEDSECCICLSQYREGVELHTLPCNHHFHCECIAKWLRINATCPLCKFNILRADDLV